MKKIIWSEKFITEIDELDKQHRFIINRINEVIELYNYKEESANIYPILLLLIGYAQFHFDYEEKYFIEHDYSKKGEHIKEHHDFSKFIDNFTELYIEGQRDIDKTLLSHLSSWWVKHILENDMEFAKELHKKGEENGD